MSTSQASILIVEDEQIVAIDIQTQLEDLGYRVSGTAISGEQACRMVERDQPDLVLMDINLDGPLDGIETAKQFRHVPIVFLTAYADADTLRRATAVEPYGYLVKPCTAADLHTTIETALAKCAADRRLREEHETLCSLVNVQPRGAIIMDLAGGVKFASQAVQRITGGRAQKADRCSLGELLGLAAKDVAAITEMSSRAPRERHNISITLMKGKSGSRQLEIEVVDNPRDGQGRFLFLYESAPFGLAASPHDRSASRALVGRSPQMREVLQAIEELACVDSTVLIEGETGTGKELVARALHHRSPRREAPFVAVNCAALSEELAASLLFGHRRGAFTGAIDNQQGYFAAAHGGTLFLDEVGDLPARVQTTLLRVLEEHAVTPLGESQPRPVNVRLLAATHRDLVRETAEQRFRQDLFYRVRVARITLPPLRDRREDIPLLVCVFLKELSSALGKEIVDISGDAMAVMMLHDWPGNVRELRNALEFAVVRAKRAVLQLQDLPPELSEESVAVGLDEAGGDEEALIRAALERSSGNRTKAAALLGVSRATLYRRLRELRIGDVPTGPARS
jgi:DNA-binding NtrC family response regulator